MAPLYAYSNGIQRHPYCRPIGGPVGFDPRRQRINHTASVVCAVGDTHHHGTRRKAQVRLAAAGSVLTAVALELVAGKTWAAGLTRKPGAGLDRYSTTRGFQLEEPPAAFGRRGRLGCPRLRKSHTDSTDGMLVTRGRGCRPRVGPPLGHPGPVCRQTDQDEEEHVAAVSGRVPRTALHGVTGTARLRRVEGSLRKPGRPGGWTLGHHPGRSPRALAAL